MLRGHPRCAVVVVGAAWLASALPPGPLQAEPTPPPQWIPVLELPHGWLPQGPLDPHLTWWHAGFRLTSQLIGNPSGGASQRVNLANGFDVTTSLGSNLMGRPPRRELDRWSLSAHVTGYVASGNYIKELGFVNSSFKPQGIVQNPDGLWLQSLWFERNEQPGHWLPSLQLGSLNLAADFFKPPAGTLYVSGLLNGHTGIEISGFPYGPLNAYGARALVRLGRSTFSYGAFQLSSVRANAALRGWSQNASNQDGVLQVLQWRQPLASSADGGPCEASTAPEPAPATGVPRPLPFRTRSGCLRQRLLQSRLPSPELRLGGFAGSWRFASINGPGQFGMASTAATTAANANSGLFGYLALPGGSLLGPRTRLWFSGSLGFMPATNPFPGFLAGGVVRQGVLRSRPEDLVLLGAGSAAASPSFAPAQASQSVVELGYQAQLNRRLSLQPYTQLLLNAGGSPQAPVWTLGLQLSWSL